MEENDSTSATVYGEPLAKGDYVAARPNSIIEARYSLENMESDIFDMFLAELTQDDICQYTIKISKYSHLYKDYDISNLYKGLKRAAKSIQTKTLTFYDEKQGKESTYTWFTKTTYIDKKGTIQVEIHKDLKDVFLDAKFLGYYNIKYSLNLRYKYSKRVYFFLKSFEKADNDTYWRKDNLITVIDKLECPESYRNNYGDFKRNVLKLSQDEINKITDIVFDYKEERNKYNSKEVTHLVFYVRKKTEEELSNLGINQLCVKEVDKTRKAIFERYLEYINQGCTNAESIKKVAEDKFVSERTVRRNVSFSKGLIEPLLKLLDDGILYVNHATKLLKIPLEEQKRDFEIIKDDIESNYIKSKKKPKKRKNTEAIDVNFVHVEPEVAVAKLDNEDEEPIQEPIEDKVVNKGTIQNPIEDKVVNKDIDKENINNIFKLIRKIDNKATIQQAREIYKNSNKDFNYVSFIYNELIKQNKEIPSPIGWLITMVVPGRYNVPQTSNINKYTGFNNFVPREYDHDKLEKQLLGWDNVEEEVVEEDNKDIEEIDDEIVMYREMLKIVMEEEVGKGQIIWLKYGIENLEFKDDIAYFKCQSDFILNRVIKIGTDKIESVIKGINCKIKKVKFIVV